MANKYDRIIKENFREPTICLLKKLTGINTVELVSKPTKMQYTMELETDMLFMVKPPKGKPFIVHLEWQASNGRNMPGRMLFYHGMIYMVHGKPVKSYVVYMGPHKLTMKDHLVHMNLNYRFDIINLMDIDPEEFLNSDIPEEVMLAIFAGRTKGEEKREIVQKILTKLHQLLKNDETKLKQKLVQFEILGKLRNIQNLIIKEEEDMALVDMYDMETDVRFMQGRERGEEIGLSRGLQQGEEMGVQKGFQQGEQKAHNTVVTNMLLTSKFSIEDIARLVNVSTDFVLNIQNTLTSSQPAVSPPQ